MEAKFCEHCNKEITKRADQSYSVYLQRRFCSMDCSVQKQRFKAPRKCIIPYQGKMLSVTDIIEAIGISESTIRGRLRVYGPVYEKLVNKPERFITEKNQTKCLCCGLEIIYGHKREFCDSICQNTYEEQPYNYGRWWKTVYKSGYPDLLVL